MDACYGLSSAKWSRVENGQVVEPELIVEPSGVVVVGTSQRERRIRITRKWSGDFYLRHWWNVVFLDNRYSQVVHRTLKPATHWEPQMDSIR